MTTACEIPQMNECAKSEYLKQFLNIYWLRPETALWRTLDCLALQNLKFEAPIVDVGCGDGLFSFTRAGGELSPNYDVFLQTGHLEQFFKKVDIYDYFDSSVTSPLVRRTPDYEIDLGLDHKESLLKKAKLLGCYRELKIADANRLLPVEDGRFRTVFSNILYWLEDYRVALAEFHRILDPGGCVVLVVPSEKFKEYLLYERLYLSTKDPKWKWLHLIDRGRSENIKLCKSYKDWKSEFESVGFTVALHKGFLSKTVLQIWDVGLRPISPLLIEMANKLKSEDRKQIKEKWIAELLPLLEPLCDLEDEKDTVPPSFHLFLLNRK